MRNNKKMNTDTNIWWIFRKDASFPSELMTDFHGVGTYDFIVQCGTTGVGLGTGMNGRTIW